MVLILILSGGLGAALAADPHMSGATGEPRQDCSVTTVHPGNAANARGSAFNDSGVAGMVYANPVSTGSSGGIHSGNSHVVSQYDVACFQQTMRELQQSARATERATRMTMSRGRGR